VSGKIVQSIDAHKGPIECMTISPDGKVILTGGRDGNLRIWTMGLYK
jgi:WD40 repeat protein